MGWFDEQIKMREQNDQEVFEESLFNLASVVIGHRGSKALKDERIITRETIDDLLKYYNFKPVVIPESIKDSEEQLEYAVRANGLMKRNIELKGKWYRDAYGPMIGFYKEDNKPVMLRPSGLSGYSYKNRQGIYEKITKKNKEQFYEEAYCFYRPFPEKKMNLADLFFYMKDCLQRADYIFYIFMVLAVTLIGTMSPRITSILTGFVYRSKNMGLLAATAMFIAAVSISTQLIKISKELSFRRLDMKISVSVEAAVIMRLMSLPMSFFRKYNSGELASRNKAVNSLASFILDGLVSAGLTSVFSLIYIKQIFDYAPGLVLPALFVIALTIGFSVFTTLIQRKVFKQMMIYNAKESGLSIGLINGVQKLKLSGAEKRGFARWADIYGKSASFAYDPPLLLKLNSALNLIPPLLGNIILYYNAVKTGVDPSDYLAFTAAYGLVMGAFSSLANIALSFAKVGPTYDMAEPVLKTEPEISTGKEIVNRISGNIELNNIYFRYAEDLPYVISGISLKISAGEYVAIVGKTGCGKTTLMRLLLGLEKPEKGSIYYDHKDMKKLDLPSLRNKIGAVTQDGKLFTGDIYSNIVISNPKLTLDDAWTAAEIAGIADDIREMPMGMNTVIAEGQGGISGGQKQRLMIAAAVASKPKVLLFDEATSALDNKTQKHIADALEGLKCTRIVIAHRLSTIKNCNRIIVLDGGKIVEDGTFDELMDQEGFFAELVEKQRLDK